MGSSKRTKEDDEEKERQRKAGNNLSAAVSRAAKKTPGYDELSKGEQKKILDGVRAGLANQSGPAAPKPANLGSIPAPGLLVLGVGGPGGGGGAVAGPAEVALRQLGWGGGGDGSDVGREWREDWALGTGDGDGELGESFLDRWYRRAVVEIRRGGDPSYWIDLLVLTYPEPEWSREDILADIHRGIQDRL